MSKLNKALADETCSYKLSEAGEKDTCKGLKALTADCAYHECTPAQDHSIPLQFDRVMDLKHSYMFARAQYS